MTEPMTDYDRGRAAGVKDAAGEVVELLDRLIQLTENPLMSFRVYRELHLQTARHTWLENAGLEPDTEPTAEPTPLQQAIERMADVLGDADDGLGYLTCTEAESIAGVLDAYQLGSDAERIRLVHGAFGDDDIEDDHHEYYLAMQRGEL